MRGMRLSALLAAIVLLLTPAMGTAHHGGRDIGSIAICQRPNVSPPRCTSVGDNLRHYVHFDASLTPELAASLRDTMAEDYDPTVLVVREQPDLTALTDVIAYSGDYGENGAAGWVNCPPDAPQGLNTRGDRWCRHQELIFNLNPRYASYLGDDGSRDYVACHELGHTIGLRHWGNPPESEGPAAATCMNADTPDGPTDLHQIDIDHINGYPYATKRWGRGFTERAVGDPLPKIVSTWTGGGVEALEVERYATLAELIAGADAVVRGRFTGVAPGRVFGDLSGYALHYAAMRLDVSELLAGTAGTEITVETPLWNGLDSLASVARTVPEGEVILFLRAKSDGPYFRLVAAGTLLTDEGGVAVAPGNAGALMALEGTAFNEAANLVRAARQAAPSPEPVSSTISAMYLTRPMRCVPR